MKVTIILLRPGEFASLSWRTSDIIKTKRGKNTTIILWWFHFLPFEQPRLASLAFLTISLQWEEDLEEDRMAWHSSKNRYLVKLVVKPLCITVCWFTELHVNEQLSGKLNHLKDVFGDSDIKRHNPISWIKRESATANLGGEVPEPWRLNSMC